MALDLEIKFVRSRAEDGCSLYNLLSDGKIIERDLDMHQVIERISERDNSLGVRHTQALKDDRRRG